MSEIVVIAGMSGAGRSEAANHLEDLGWFVMDNLPPLLLRKVADLADGMNPVGERLALVVGNSHYHSEILSLIDGLRPQVDRLQVVFMDAANEVLLRRYESTRRRHPFADPDSAPTLADAIRSEREALGALRTRADLLIDTSDLNVHQLYDRISEAFDSGGEGAMRITVMSFGYKHGLPRDVDLVFDCRFLPNPYWEPELSELCGLDAAVVDYVLGQPAAEAFLERLDDLLTLLLPHYVAEGKSYLTVAFGCTGGQHRSVAIAERVAETLGALGTSPAVVHRDVHR